MDKDCFTKFPNHLLEAIISSKFHGMQTAVLLYIIRKTYGWSKDSDQIAIAKMAKDTGYTRQALIRTVQQLEQDNVISVKRNGAGKMSEMSVNDPDSWGKHVTCRLHVTHKTQCSAGYKGVTHRSQVSVTSRPQEGVTHRLHTKETKDTVNKKTKESFSPTGERTDNEGLIQTDSADVNDGSWSPDPLDDIDLSDDSLWT